MKNLGFLKSSLSVYFGIWNTGRGSWNHKVWHSKDERQRAYAGII